MVKHADSDADDLKQLADAALGQIDRKDYVAALRAEGVADIVKIGLAYHRKRVELTDRDCPVGETFTGTCSVEAVGNAGNLV